MEDYEKIKTEDYDVLDSARYEKVTSQQEDSTEEEEEPKKETKKPAKPQRKPMSVTLILSLVFFAALVVLAFLVNPRHGNPDPKPQAQPLDVTIPTTPETVSAPVPETVPTPIMPESVPIIPENIPTPIIPEDFPVVEVPPILLPEQFVPEVLVPETFVFEPISVKLFDPVTIPILEVQAPNKALTSTNSSLNLVFEALQPYTQLVVFQKKGDGDEVCTTISKFLDEVLERFPEVSIVPIPKSDSRLLLHFPRNSKWYLPQKPGSKVTLEEIIENFPDIQFVTKPKNARLAYLFNLKKNEEKNEPRDLPSLEIEVKKQEVKNGFFKKPFSNTWNFILKLWRAMLDRWNKSRQSSE